MRTNIAHGNLSVQPLGKGTHQNKSDPPRWVWLARGGGWNEWNAASDDTKKQMRRASRWMLETQASLYAADVDRCLSASYRENLQKRPWLLQGRRSTLRNCWCCAAYLAKKRSGGGERRRTGFILSLLKGHISSGQTLTKRALHWKALLSLMLSEMYDFYSDAFIKKKYIVLC